MLIYELFEDTIGVIRISKSKDRLEFLPRITEFSRPYTMCDFNVPNHGISLNEHFSEDEILCLKFKS
jgi:hypothetical protein